ncbi:MAG: hypothetical protein ACOH5I_23290 [Oligoflexus sp.]
MSRFALIILIISLVSGQVFASTKEERFEINRKQAIITKQLDLAERIGSIHGRYRAIRDKHLNGNGGLFQITTSLYSEIDAWLKGWLEGLRIVGEQELIASVENQGDNGLMMLLYRQNQKLEKIASHHNQLISVANTGYNLSLQLPRYKLDEFEKEIDRGHSDGIYIHHFKDNLEFFNMQIDEMTKVFREAKDNLVIYNEDNIIDQLRNLNHQLFLKFDFLIKFKKIRYPDLEERIALAEKMLATDKALAPIISHISKLYEIGLNQHSRSNFLGIRSTLNAMETEINSMFSHFIGKEAYDQSRVNQFRAILSLQMKSLENKAELTVESYGGHIAALKSYLYKYAYSDSTSPYWHCREYDGVFAETRLLYDCNLYRKNVYPFLFDLDKVDDETLELIARQLHTVYLGPLAKGDFR